MPFGQAGLSYFCLSLIIAGGNNQNVSAKERIALSCEVSNPVMESNLKLHSILQFYTNKFSVLGFQINPFSF